MIGRVLIVEDPRLVAVGLQLALSARGWEVETTEGPTPADIIDQARRCLPQCVLLDIRLGEGVGSGIDLIAPLRATGADVGSPVAVDCEHRWRADGHAPPMAPA